MVQSRMSFAVCFGFGHTDLFVLELATSIVIVLDLETSIFSYCFCLLTHPVGSVADPECLSRIPDPIFFPSLIPGSGSEFFSYRIRIKEFKYFNPKKLVSNLSEIWSGFFIPDPDPDCFYPSRNQGSKAPDPGSGSATLAMDPELYWLPYITSNFLCRTARNATSALRRTGGATTCSASTASTSSAGCVWGTGAPTVQNTTNAQGQLEISWIALFWLNVSNPDQAFTSIRIWIRYRVCHHTESWGY
jgi:hypothetical protein